MQRNSSAGQLDSRSKDPARVKSGYYEPKFTDQQHAKLRGFGLGKRQIFELQECLYYMREMLRKPPAVNDIRDELRKVEGQARDLFETLKKLREASPNYNSNRFHAALSINTHFWNERGAKVVVDTDRLLPMLDRLAGAAEESRIRLPTNPARHKKASAEAVDFIYSMITYYGLQESNGLKLHFEVEGAANEKSKLFGIVKICFEAATGTQANPLRAVRAWVARQKKASEEIADYASAYDDEAADALRLAAEKGLVPPVDKGARRRRK